MMNSKPSKPISVLEVGLVAFLVLAAVVIALVATDGTAGPAADTSGPATGSLGTAIVKTNTGGGN